MNLRSSFAEIESQAKQCAEISVNSHLNKLSMDPSSAISISEIICNLVEGGNVRSVLPFCLVYSSFHRENWASESISCPW